MESTVVARSFLKHEIPLTVIRGISDYAGQNMTPLSRKHAMRTVATVLHVLLKDPRFADLDS